MLGSDDANDARRFLRTLLSNLPGYVYRCRNDPAYTLEFISEGVEQVTGYPSSAFLIDRTITCAQKILEEDRDRVWNEVQAALDRRSPYKSSYRIHHRCGEVRWVWEQGRGIWNESGALVALEGFVTEITHQVRLNEELERARKFEAVNRVAAGLLHDFKNVLQMITGYATMIGDARRDPARIRELAAGLSGVADQAQELVSRVFTFTGGVDTSSVPLDLDHHLLEIHEQMVGLAGGGIRVELSLAGGLPLISFDRVHLVQVLTNLVSNARDAMPEGGSLLIETFLFPVDTGQEISPSVQLRVSDSGTGMSREVVSRIFEPFYTTKPAGKGTGVGLATVYALLRQHGGKIDVESEAGRGTAFTLQFRTAPQT